jgi:hypothetical protein
MTTVPINRQYMYTQLQIPRGRTLTVVSCSLSQSEMTFIPTMPNTVDCGGSAADPSPSTMQG